MILQIPVLQSSIPPNAIIMKLETIKKEIAEEKQTKLDAMKAIQQAQAVLQAQAVQIIVQPTASYPSACIDGKSCIYMHESGNNPGAINASSGACGLGQALPCSKMGCSLSDYACQDAFFTHYAISTYGSWDAAWNFWQVHSWW